MPKNCSKMRVRNGAKCDINNYSLNDLMNVYSGNLSNELYFWNYEKEDFYNSHDETNNYYRKKTLQYYFSSHKCVRIPIWAGKELLLNYTQRNRTRKENDIGLNTITRQAFESNLEDLFLLEYFLDVKHSLNKTNYACLFVTIFFHEHDTIGHNHDSPFARYWWDPGAEPNVARLHYQQITTNYLKYPFKHNCIKYDKNSTYGSKGDCVEACTKKEIFKKYGKVGRVQSTVVYDDIVPKDAPFKDEESNMKCNQICHLDCNTVQYNPKLAFLWSHNNRKHVFRVQLLSGYPQTFISFSAKFDMLSYFIFVGGIFGMWMGLDLFTSTSNCIQYLCKIGKKALAKISH